MRKLIILSFVICTLISCKKGEKFDIEKYPQKWQLIRITGEFSGRTGSDMEWQEFYFLNANGTFTKSRKRNGTITEESGSFIFKNITGDMFLELTYMSNNGLIGNCDNSLTEYLQLRSEHKITGTWSACDGPYLEYERIE